MICQFFRLTLLSQLSCYGQLVVVVSSQLGRFGGATSLNAASAAPLSSASHHSVYTCTDRHGRNGAHYPCE